MHGVFQRLGDVLLHRDSIGQPGQQVVLRQMRQLLGQPGLGLQILFELAVGGLHRRSLLLEFGMLVQRHEHFGFRTQDRRVQRLEDAVHRAGLVGLAQHDAVGRMGRDEDDRRAARALALTDQRRGLEPAHAGHLHVQQDQCEVALQHLAQGLRARGGPNQVDLQVVQGGLEQVQVDRVVIDHQDRWRCVHGLVAQRAQRGATIASGIRPGAGQPPVCQQVGDSRRRSISWPDARLPRRPPRRRDLLARAVRLRRREPRLRGERRPRLHAAAAGAAGPAGQAGRRVLAGAQAAGLQRQRRRSASRW